MITGAVLLVCLHRILILWMQGYLISVIISKKVALIINMPTQFSPSAELDGGTP